MVITALLLALNSPAAAPRIVPATAGTDDPPIRVWLNDNNYQPGDRATVKIRLADDGYVVVLRADAQGHLRILFPLDPGTDNFVKGGKTFEVRARGDRDAFQVDDQPGSGTIFAAVSAQPFTFNGFVLGDHWDYKALGDQDVGSDPEAAMVDLVHNMAGNNHFDYDVTTYTVASAPSVAYSDGGYYPTYYPGCWGCGPWYPGSGVFIGFRFGHPYYNSCYYDPFWCDFYGGFGYPYDPFFSFGFSYGFYRPFYRPFYPRYTFYTNAYRPFAPNYRPPFAVPVRTTAFTPMQPRNRFGGTTTPVTRTRPDIGTRRGGGERGGSVAPSRGGSRPTARPAPAPSRGGGRDAPAPSRGRGHDDQSFSRPAPRSDYRPAPRMESRPAPQLERRSFSPSPSRSYSAPRSSAPAPRGGGGGGGGGGGRGGRHGR